MTTKAVASFPEAFLEEVLRVAREEHRSRSELLREAMRLYIEVRRTKSRPGSDPRVQAAVAMRDMLALLLVTTRTAASMSAAGARHGNGGSGRHRYVDRDQMLPPGRGVGQ